MNLTTAQRDRAAGVLLATAAGDALGAGYEFGPPLPASTAVTMTGGGGFGWAPGEWTDDTSMAIVIAQVAARGGDLRVEAVQDAIVRGWQAWAAQAKDIGVQTRTVFRRAGLAAHATKDSLPSVLCRGSAKELHSETGRTAGNGSLMRTAPVALAYLDDEPGLAEAAASISSLTHFDPEAGEACVLWCLAIRHAVLTGELDVRRGLAKLPLERAAVWEARLDEAESHEPAHFTNNGWVVHALQAAWSAIHGTPEPEQNPAAGTFRAQHLQHALENAVRGGRDADTVAAIAGGLLGAAWGASAVPATWRRTLHGWPGLRARDLVALGSAIVGGTPFDGDYSAYGDVTARAQLPFDEHVWLGGIDVLRNRPGAVDAVVSLCRIGPDDLPTDAELIEVRLMDDARPEENPHLEFVLHDTVALLEQLRAEGKTVALHCVQAHSRTPTVAALYSARLHAIPTDLALKVIQDVLPHAHPNTAFAALLKGVSLYRPKRGIEQLVRMVVWGTPVADVAAEFAAEVSRVKNEPTIDDLYRAMVDKGSRFEDVLAPVEDAVFRGEITEKQYEEIRAAVRGR